MKMFNLDTLLKGVESSNYSLVTQQLDCLLDEYFEGNANKAYYDFRFAFCLLPETFQKIYKSDSVFHNELQIYPLLTALP